MFEILKKLGEEKSALEVPAEIGAKIFETLPIIEKDGYIVSKQIETLSSSDLLGSARITYSLVSPEDKSLDGIVIDVDSFEHKNNIYNMAKKTSEGLGKLTERLIPLPENITSEEIDAIFGAKSIIDRIVSDTETIHDYFDDEE